VEGYLEELDTSKTKEDEVQRFVDTVHADATVPPGLEEEEQH
jgi:hypothetical protein